MLLRLYKHVVICIIVTAIAIMASGVDTFAADDYQGLFNNTLNIIATDINDQELLVVDGEETRHFNNQYTLMRIYNATNGEGTPTITQDLDTNAYSAEMPVVYVYVSRKAEKFKLSLVDLTDEPDYAAVFDLTKGVDPEVMGDTYIGYFFHVISNAQTYWVLNENEKMFCPDLQSGEEIELPIVSDSYVINDGGYLTSAILDFKYTEDEECIAAIDALPETITLNDLEAVKAARAKYDALAQYEGAQDNITNYAKLTAAEETIANLVKGEADPVKDTISSLPKASELTLNDKAAVEAARTAYEALSDEAKEYVDNITTLELAEATIAKLEAQAELAQAKDALNQALENAEPEEDIDKLTDQVKQAKADLKEANEELTVAKETVKIQKVVIKKLKAKAQKKKTTVSWKSAGQGYQYEVYKSTKMSKGFKKAVTTKKVKAVVKKLKSKKTYYVKVRGFKAVNGKKVYTQFSDAVSVKVK
jgi:hypothetical protein